MFPLLLFAAVLAAYAAVTLGILMSGGLVSLLLVPLSGVIVMMLFVIGHDACHQSYTSSHALNDWIGRIAFLPALHVFSLWDHEHNRIHHRFNNIRGMDYAWIPWDSAEYAQAGAFGRAKYRFYRNPVGVLFYYLFEIWGQRKIWPRAKHLGEVKPRYVWDVVLLWGFVALYVALLMALGSWFGRAAWESVLYALVLPFLIFSAGISFAVFLHHNHYDAAWYKDVAQWKRENGALYGTVHVVFPWIVRMIFLQIMEHNAHHVAPGVPLYHLQGMQEVVERRGVVVWKFSPKKYFRVCRRCKLFDYERGQWTGYDGKATSSPAIAGAAA